MKKIYLPIIVLLVIILILLMVLKQKTILKPIEKESINKSGQIHSANDSTAGYNKYEITEVKPLFQETVFIAPVWSPDGQKVAVTTLNYSGIIINDQKEGTQKKITEDEGAGFRFSWSPDSREIVYLSRSTKDGDPENTIKTVNSETGKITELTRGKTGESLPSFKKDGSIIYSLAGILMEREALSDNRSGERRYKPENAIAGNVSANVVALSPDNRIMVVEDNEGIKIMDTEGKTRKIVVKNGERDFACNAQFSPSGEQIMFFNNAGSAGHLYIYDLKTERVTDLGEGSMGQWTPDEKIIYCISVNDGYRLTGSDIYLINPDGSGKTRVTSSPDLIELYPALSPDGKTMVFRDEKSGKILTGKLKKIE